MEIERGRLVRCALALHCRMSGTSARAARCMRLFASTHSFLGLVLQVRGQLRQG